MFSSTYNIYRVSLKIAKLPKDGKDCPYVHTVELMLATTVLIPLPGCFPEQGRGGGGEGRGFTWESR